MVKIKGTAEISVRKTNNRGYEISTVYGGYYRHRLYLGYTQKEAIKLFVEALKKGEV